MPQVLAMDVAKMEIAGLGAIKEMVGAIQQDLVIVQMRANATLAQIASLDVFLIDLFLFLIKVSILIPDYAY